MYRRYAIYYAPYGPLADVGAAWLGWDISAGCTVPHPRLEGLDVTALTKRPRKYGLHATIKPPMALASSKTSKELIQAAGAVARSVAPIILDGLTVSRIGSFLALTVQGDATALNNMAALIVETLDPFRAPPSPEELARRRKKPLTPSQEYNLTRWGYPNVMDDFRFHMTLTGPLKNAESIAPHVAAHFEPVLPVPFTINHLIVAGEDAAGMFHSIARLPLGG